MVKNSPSPSLWVFTEKQQKLAIFNKLLILISLNISGLNFSTAKIGQCSAIKCINAIDKG
jgi:hypothetical protein